MKNKLIDMRVPKNYNSTPLPLVYAPTNEALTLGVDVKNDAATWEYAEEAIEVKIPFFTPKAAKVHRVERLHKRPYGSYVTSFTFSVYFYR